MRILLVHNRYQQPGGEDVVFQAEAGLLRSHGHEVEEWVEDNRDIEGIPRVGLALRTVWSLPAARRLSAILDRHRPDVAHFHNTFPLISPAAYAICQRRGVPVVQTLHNYRLVCPNAMLFRAGRPCEDCLGRVVAWPGVVHACYRGSRAQSAVTATMLAVHRLRGTWRHDVDLYIALTEFARRKFLAGGLPEERIVVKPNFVTLKGRPAGPPAEGFLFAGRLSEEKGVRALLEAWRSLPSTILLRVAGTGPLAPLVERAARELPNVHYLGGLSHDELLGELAAAQALVFPSEWYEGLPMVILEAFACGRPVLAARRGAAEEIVAEGLTGSLWEPGDPANLATLVRRAAAQPERLVAMGTNARREYEQRYSAEANYRQLIEIYRRARQRSR